MDSYLLPPGKSIYNALKEYSNELNILNSNPEFGFLELFSITTSSNEIIKYIERLYTKKDPVTHDFMSFISDINQRPYEILKRNNYVYAVPNEENVKYTNRII
mgnify:CR=1 FL=1